MLLRHLMTPRPAAIGPDVPFDRLLDTYRDMESQLLYVVDPEGRLLGVISSYDVLRVMLPFYLDSNLAKALPDDETLIRHACVACRHLTASDIMVKDFAALAPDDPFLTAEALFAERGVNVLPVLDAAGRLVGELSRRTALKHLAARCHPDPQPE
jgi:CBS-domain-containing membrane protein